MRQLLYGPLDVAEGECVLILDAVEARVAAAYLEGAGANVWKVWPQEYVDLMNACRGAVAYDPFRRDEL